MTGRGTRLRRSNARDKMFAGGCKARSGVTLPHHDSRASEFLRPCSNSRKLVASKPERAIASLPCTLVLIGRRSRNPTGRNDGLLERKRQNCWKRFTTIQSGSEREGFSISKLCEKRTKASISFRSPYRKAS